MPGHLPVDAVVLAAGLLVAAGVLIAGAAQGARVPGLLVFLALGMLVADDGLEIVQFHDAELAQSVAVVALVLILFEGGLATPGAAFRRVLAPAAPLATVGVVVACAVVAGVSVLLLDVPATTAWLIGAVVAPTDAAAVVSVLRRTPVSHRIATLLEAESGLNDPLALLLTVGVLTTWQGDGDVTWWVLFGLRQLVLGGVIGFITGKVGARVVESSRLEGAGLHAVLAGALAAIAYGAAALVGGSGLLAVFLTGLLLGRDLQRHRDLLRVVHDGFASMAQIALFTLLGLLVFPSQLPGVAAEGLAVAVTLALIARPLGVAAALVWFRTGWRELLFLSWAGLRGAVPIVLATFAVTADHPDGQLVFDLVFFVVLVSVLVQGLTIAPLARALGLHEDRPTASDIAVLALDVPGVDVLEMRLEASAPVVGRALRDVPMPGGLMVSVIVRGGETFVPSGRTELLGGDELIVVADSHIAEGALHRWAGNRPVSGGGE